MGKTPYALLFGFLVVLMLAHAAYDIRQPLDCDESAVVANFERGTLIRYYFEPLTASAHTASSMLSGLSMSVFGAGPFGARVPGLLISALNLVLIGLIAIRYLHWSTGVLLGLNLFVNEHVNWFFHSARAYPLAMLLGVLIPALLCRDLFLAAPTRRRLYLQWGSLFVLAVLAYQLCIVYFVTTIATALAWGYLLRKELAPGVRATMEGYRRVAYVTFPISVAVLMASAVGLRKTGYLNQTGSEVDTMRQLAAGIAPLYKSFLGVFGSFTAITQLALVGVTLALLFLERRRLVGRGPLGLLWAVVFANIGACSILSLVTVTWNVRFFVYLLPLVIALLGETTVRMGRRALRVGVLAALFWLIVWVPIWQSHPGIATCFPLDLAGPESLRHRLLGGAY